MSVGSPLSPEDGGEGSKRAPLPRVRGRGEQEGPSPPSTGARGARGPLSPEYGGEGRKKGAAPLHPSPRRGEGSRRPRAVAHFLRRNFCRSQARSAMRLIRVG